MQQGGELDSTFLVKLSSVRPVPRWIMIHPFVAGGPGHPRKPPRPAWRALRYRPQLSTPGDPAWRRPAVTNSA
jgi:hypothetical protein